MGREVGTFHHGFHGIDADALFDADTQDCSDYEIQHSDGSISYNDEGQELFACYYDQAETILNGGGIEPDG
jgi:hypothetical protein